MTPADTTPGRRDRTAAGALSGMRSAGVALGFAEAVVAFVDAKATPVVVVDGGVIDATAQRLKEFEIAEFGPSDKFAPVQDAQQRHGVLGQGIDQHPPGRGLTAAAGVSRQSLHTWIARYLADGLAGLADRSRRPRSCPHQVSTVVEVKVAEMRREHPRWGSKRIRMELLRKPVAGVVVPSTATINRILTRQGLVVPRPRKRPRDSYVRWERPGPMQLCGMDIVGRVMLVNPVTGELREAKVVTAVDDHSRFCVSAKVVEHATSRAVCLALAEAPVRFGVPEEVLTDNGKQFTDRFGKGGEVLSDKICRKNAITHRLTALASPNQNGKVERFHGTFRPDFLDQVGPFTSIEEAQAAVDVWVADYNAQRPHQGLDDKFPVTPAERFEPVPAADRESLLGNPRDCVSEAPARKNTWAPT
ncbi:MAG TPA: IS481 family transposase [Dermatophilaceae bacterium]